MKRLTTRTSMDGKAKLIVADGTLSDKLIEQIAIQRLAEYEDTGLEPKEINEKMNEAYDLGAQSVLRYKGLTWSEAEELLRYREAEEQGLLVRLPCKAGDRVYFLDICHTAEDFGKKFVSWGEVTKVSIAGMYVCLKIPTGLPLALSWESIFTTREAAEKALEDA